MTHKELSILVNAGVSAYDLTAAIGQTIRETAEDYGITLTEAELANVLVMVHDICRA